MISEDRLETPTILFTVCSKSKKGGSTDVENEDILRYFTLGRSMQLVF